MADLEMELEALEDQIVGLEGSIGSTIAVSAAFQAELSTMQATMAAAGQDASGLATSIGYGLRKAFDGLVFDGMRLSDALGVLARSMADAALTQALKPVQNALGGLISAGLGALLPFENGAAFSSGKVTAFARGGVVSSPTGFAMRGGLGLMGEAGPEAIMPLARGADGKLGVRADGGRSVQVTMNISTPDVAGFQRSRSQIAAQLGRALGHGSRNR